MCKDRFLVEAFPLSLCSVIACPNRMDILCDKLLNKPLKGANTGKKRSRLTVSKALCPQGSVSHLNMDRVLLGT